MKTISFFDTKPYDKYFFDKQKGQYDFEINYFEEKLNRRTARMAEGSDAVVAFVTPMVLPWKSNPVRPFKLKLYSLVRL